MRELQEQRRSVMNSRLKVVPSLIMQREALRSYSATSRRTFASAAEKDLKATLRDVIPGKRELLKKVKSHGSKVIGEVKVENTIGGMRSLASSTI